MGLLADRPLRLLQPTGIPEIDWRNPLARGLQFCFDGQSKTDVTRRKQLAATGLLKPTKSGRGLGYEVLGSSTVAQMAGRTFEQGTGLTFFVMVDHGTSSSYQAMIGRGTNSNSTDTLFGFNAGSLVLYGGGGPEGSDPLGSVQSAGLHSYGVACAGTSCTGYVDGKAANTITYTFYMDYAANTWLVGASSLDYLDENLLGTYLIAAAWNRPLSANEMRSLNANPWEIFDAPLRIIPVQGPGGGNLAAAATGSATASGSATIGALIDAAASGAGVASGAATAGVAVPLEASGEAAAAGAAQIAAAMRYSPVADIAAGAWLPSSGSDLYSMLDETVADDADYIYATSASTAILQLRSAGDPSSSAGHVLRYRLLAGSGKIAVALKQGATTIASWGPHSLIAAAQDFAQTLTAGEADSITDYSALRVEVTSST